MLSKGTFSQFLTVNFEFVHNKCADTKVQTLCGGKNAGENDGNITAAAGSQCDFSNECNVHSKQFLEVLFVFALIAKKLKDRISYLTKNKINQSTDSLFMK